MPVNYPRNRTGAGLHVACIADDQSTFVTVREVLLTHLPSTNVERMTVAAMRRTAADCAVVDSGVDGQPAVDVLRDLRAGGYAGRVILLAETVSPYAGPAAAQLGAHHILSRAAIVAELPDAILDPVEVAPPVAAAELARTRRMIAAGEIATRLQHAINNPLTALLAEAQVLEMAELPPEHRMAVQRMVELCRRTIGVVRRLDILDGT